MIVRDVNGKCGLYLIALILMSSLLAGCKKNDITYRTQGKAFGASVEISIYREPEARANVLGTRVLSGFERFHHKNQAWPPSALTALNESIGCGEPYQADAEMVDLLKAATVLAENPVNTFNPAIGHLIRLWGFQGNGITLHRAVGSGSGMVGRCQSAHD